MVVDLAKIERLEKELEEARRELLREDGERYRILMRDIGKEEKDRILGALTDKRERVLFGLEAPEERRGELLCVPAEQVGIDLFVLRKDRAYQKGFGATCGETAQVGN